MTICKKSLAISVLVAILCHFLFALPISSEAPKFFIFVHDNITIPLWVCIIGCGILFGIPEKKSSSDNFKLLLGFILGGTLGFILGGTLGFILGGPLGFILGGTLGFVLGFILGWSLGEKFN